MYKDRQSNIDKAADQAATQAAALVISRLKPALKQAIKDLVKDFRADAIEYVLTEKWVRALIGLLFIAGLVATWIKERAG